MTVLLVDQAPASPVKPPRRVDRGANARRASPPPAGGAAETWRHVPRQARSCRVVAPRMSPLPAASAPSRVVHRYAWTDRGVAAMVAGVALVLGVLAITVLAAFFSISNEPVSGVQPGVAAVAAR